jgi:hypothetical protein
VSVQALGWVLDHSPTRGSDRLVLISIANHAGKEPTADGTWEAWPGVELMRREAGLERTRTVQDALARLVATGALERTINGAPDERIRKDQRPNLYRIVMDHGVTCGVTRCTWCGVTRGAERDDAPRPDGVTLDDATGCRRASPEPSVNPSEEPEEQPQLALVDAPAPALVDRFDEFWSAFPRKVGKGQARPAWKRALGKADPDRIIAGAGRYRDDPNRDESFTAHPTTWLNGERWDDPALPPRGGQQQTARMARIASRPDGLRRFAEAAGYDVDDPDSPLALPQEGTT